MKVINKSLRVSYIKYNHVKTLYYAILHTDITQLLFFCVDICMAGDLHASKLLLHRRI